VVLLLLPLLGGGGETTNQRTDAPMDAALTAATSPTPPGGEITINDSDTADADDNVLALLSLLLLPLLLLAESEVLLDVVEVARKLDARASHRDSSVVGLTAVNANDFDASRDATKSRRGIASNNMVTRNVIECRLR
jgi:hypothetical protein